MRTTFFAASLITALSGAALLSACSGDIGELPFGSGGAGGGGGAGGDPVNDPQFAPAPGGIRRLLGRQYVNTIRVVLGEAAAQKAAPPEDVTLNEFETLAAAELSVPPNAVEQYETSAQAVAAAVIADSGAMAKLVPCVPLAPDDAECHKQVIEGIGHQLWRRPLTPDEVAPIVTIAQNAGSEYADFNLGVEYSLLVLLQSPYFLYTVEVGVTDPEHPEWRKLTAPELATRMSLFLIDTAPDATLLAAAEGGGLQSEDEIRAAATAMLADPAARKALTSFYDVFFKLRELPTLTKIPANFPEWNGALAESTRQETLTFLDDLVFEQDADYRTLFTADYTFVDANLAALYGVAAPPGAGFTKVTLPAKQGRSGFLGHASILARYAHAADTSPTRRGVFLSNFLLCNEIPPPPPGVNTVFPEFDPDKPQTKKQYLEDIHHKVSDNCISCHAQMDPYGYALESYDGIGKYRTLDENGLTLDPSGEVADFGAFANAKELGQLMHDDQRSMNCIVSNLFRQAMGHKETKGERPAISALNKSFADAGFKLQDAIVDIVASPAFSYVGDPK